jgi:hypothetical protein
MTFLEAQRIWQTIGNEVAEDCFDADRQVDVERLTALMEFFGNAESFQEEPFCFIPYAEFVRSQVHMVCEDLVRNKNHARDLLNASAGIPLSPQGSFILVTTSQGRQPPLDSSVAILATSFVPNRQVAFLTCTIHSRINADIRNHLERLIKIYIQMLIGDQFTLPSGHILKLQPIDDDGFTTVDLTNGGKVRDKVFCVITSGDPAKSDEQIAKWRQAGIKYNPAEKYKLRLPVHNMNDLLFAHLFQASNFGNKKINDYDSFGAMLIYTGYSKRAEMYPTEIQVAEFPSRRFAELFPTVTRTDKSKFLAGMAKLKEQAEVQWQLEYRYMHVATVSSDGGHAENIDISALLALNLDSMESGKAYPIGDRNWGGTTDKSQDIPRLAVRKMDGPPPTYEFGTLRGSEFEKDDIFMFQVYGTEIKKPDSSSPGFFSYIRSFFT